MSLESFNGKSMLLKQLFLLCRQILSVMPTDHKPVKMATVFLCVKYIYNDTSEHGCPMQRLPNLL